MLSRGLFRSFTAYQKPFKNWAIVKGDAVMVNFGKDKGKAGEVLHVYRKTNRVLVSNVNIKMKRFKGDPQGESKGGTKPIIKSIHVSNVNLLDPETKQGTKVRRAYLADGTKVRVSKASGTIIGKPDRESVTYINRNVNRSDGPLDTPPTKVLEVTYLGEDFLKIREEFENQINEKERIEKLLVFDK